MKLDDIPQIDLQVFLDKEDGYLEQCEAVRDCLCDYGILFVKDPRVSNEHNVAFLDLMEKYFDQEDEAKENDIKQDLHYQVGATPSKIELARDHCSKVEKLDEDNRAVTICPPEADIKWRFFWRIGDLPEETEFPSLNADPVIPEGFDDWEDTMNTWGEKMIGCVEEVAKMAALGFGLEENTFYDYLQKAPHLLAPTGSDLKLYHNEGDIFASFHYDLNFLTIHGKSRFPGLYVWLRDGTRCPVKVPDGCLLLQAGKQFEWLTGGKVLAGFHEVVVSDATVKAYEKAKENGNVLWRVSSTLFGHTASDKILEPIGDFANEENAKNYPPTKAGKQVMDELNAIKLGSRGDRDDKASKL